MNKIIKLLTVFTLAISIQFIGINEINIHNNDLKISPLSYQIEEPDIPIYGEQW